MKKLVGFVLSLAAALIAAASLCPVPAAAVSGDGRAEELAEEILAYKLAESGAADLQDWVSGALAAGAGETSEWYAMALGQSGRELDFSAYYAALHRWLAGHRVTGEVTRDRYALALIAVGARDDAFVDAAASSAGGQGGVMSTVFALHLTNNGVSCAAAQETLIETLLSLQFADGGWALAGERADTDVTAMVLQALAVHREDGRVAAAVERGVACLASLQLPGGDFQSFGSPNAESTAQVIIALASLGIDPFSDARFVQNGATPLDGLARYRLAGGAYAHTAGGEANNTATVQALMALVAAGRCARGAGPFYQMDGLTRRTEILEYPAAAPEPEAPSGGGTPVWKIWAWIAVGAVTAGAVVWTLVRRKPRRAAAAVLLGAAAAAAVFFLNIQSPSDYYGDGADAVDPVGTVTLSIRCDVLTGVAEVEHVPGDGVILPETEIEFSRGETVYDALIRAARKNGIQIDKKSSGGGLVYVCAIGYLYELTYGDLSGWIYRVNGETPYVGCAEYVLSDGDRIQWDYTLNLGLDVGGS